ncbi:hypothetical protein [Wenxinia marina]|uniref:Uncharacterized protein n=1 Tax=Wenxinia marina DSM 24838 TaxID=1123501 RepID=A0A0D0QC37_9RHOB|nr:hypothetical protein [Wenxinia marina]KIQ69867.1 hypothetical protein Wenmar_01437 [Wenxinia marina DSM 24838]GGL61806.1 hypothetical protein GCM10011392_15400 [Wenxinia marina]
MRTATLSLAVLATPAAALEPLPPCFVDGGGVMHPANAAPAGARVPDFVEPVTNGFVMWAFPSGEREGVVLQHCPTGDYLRVIAEADNDVAGDTFFSMLQSERAYTLEQMAATLETLGVETFRGRGGMGTCACDFLGDVAGGG